MEISPGKAEKVWKSVPSKALFPASPYEFLRQSENILLKND